MGRLMRNRQIPMAMGYYLPIRNYSWVNSAGDFWMDSAALNLKIMITIMVILLMGYLKVTEVSLTVKRLHINLGRSQYKNNNLMPISLRKLHPRSNKTGWEDTEALINSINNSKISTSLSTKIITKNNKSKTNNNNNNSNKIKTQVNSIYKLKVKNKMI